MTIIEIRHKKLLYIAMRLSWSSDPFSRWSAFNCLPALIHMFQTWQSKVNLSLISMPNIYTASEDGGETSSTVTFNWASLMLMLLTSKVWNWAWFAARDFFLNHSISETISLFNVSVIILIERPARDMQLSSAKLYILMPLLIYHW